MPQLLFAGRSLLSILAFLSACATIQKGELELVSPAIVSIKGYNPTPIVESLQPTLKWQNTGSPARFDLAIFLAMPRTGTGIGQPIFYVPGREVYFREDLELTDHRVDTPLPPGTKFLWAVRPRRGDKSIGPWSRYDYHGGIALSYVSTTGRNLWWGFQTPEVLAPAAGHAAALLPARQAPLPVATVAAPIKGALYDIFFSFDRLVPGDGETRPRRAATGDHAGASYRPDGAFIRYHHAEKLDAYRRNLTERLGVLISTAISQNSVIVPDGEQALHLAVHLHSESYSTAPPSAALTLVYEISDARAGRVIHRSSVTTQAERNVAGTLRIGVETYEQNIRSFFARFACCVVEAQ